MTVSIFTLLFGLMPSQLFTNQTDYEVPNTQDREVVDTLNAYDLVAYQSTWEFDLSLYDMAYNESGLSSGHRIEVHWNYFPYAGKAIQVKHAYPSPLGDWWLWSNVMTPTEEYQDILDVDSSPIALNWALFHKLEENNVVKCEFSDGEVNANFIFLPYNDTWSLQDSWDNGIIHVVSSYEIDFDAMKPNAWFLLAQLLFFQSPDFGIPGMFGDILNYCIALGFWIVTAVIVFTVITRLIPTIQGGIED